MHHQPRRAARERPAQGLEGPPPISFRLYVRSIPNWVVLLVVLSLGLLLGWLTPNKSLARPWDSLQSATGWSYTLAW